MAELTKRIEDIIRKTVEDLGYDVINVKPGTVGGKHSLIITIDKKGGVTAYDCARTSRILMPILEEIDPIQGSYHLIVQSPGIK